MTLHRICVSLSIITTAQGSLPVQLSTDNYQPSNLDERTSTRPVDIIGVPSEGLRDNTELSNNVLRNHIDGCVQPGL